MYFLKREVQYCFAFLPKKQNRKSSSLHAVLMPNTFRIRGSNQEYVNALSELKNSGAEILHEHLWKNNLHSFYVHDPDKHLVEIIEQGLWEDNARPISG